MRKSARWVSMLPMRRNVRFAAIEHLDRALARFEEICSVPMSVKQGIALTIRVADSTRHALK